MPFLARIVDAGRAVMLILYFFKTYVTIPASHMLGRFST